jgi:hypothetical protein
MQLASNATAISAARSHRPRRKLPPAAAGSLGEDSDPHCPANVTYAFSSQGREFGDSLLAGHNDVLNRYFRFPRGWYAVHACARNKLAVPVVMQLRHLCPKMPAAWKSQTGAVLGMVFVAEVVPYKVLCRRANCTCKGSRHHASCMVNPFAEGPQCNIVTAAIRLLEPIICPGKNLCRWRLPKQVLDKVRERLMHPEMKTVVAEAQLAAEQLQAVPRNWPLPWLAPGTSRHYTEKAGAVPTRFAAEAAGATLITPTKRSLEQRTPYEPGTLAVRPCALSILLGSVKTNVTHELATRAAERDSTVVEKQQAEGKKARDHTPSRSGVAGDTQVSSSVVGDAHVASGVVLGKKRLRAKTQDIGTPEPARKQHRAEMPAEASLRGFGKRGEQLSTPPKVTKLAAQERKNLSSDAKLVQTKKYDDAMAASQECNSHEERAANIDFKAKATNSKKWETQLPRNLGRCYIDKNMVGGSSAAKKLLKELFQMGMSGATRSEIEERKRAKSKAAEVITI